MIFLTYNNWIDSEIDYSGNHGTSTYLQPTRNQDIISRIWSDYLEYCQYNIRIDGKTFSVLQSGKLYWKCNLEDNIISATIDYKGQALLVATELPQNPRSVIISTYELPTRKIRPLRDTINIESNLNINQIKEIRLSNTGQYYLFLCQDMFIRLFDRTKQTFLDKKMSFGVLDSKDKYIMSGCYGELNIHNIDTGLLMGKFCNCDIDSYHYIQYYEDISSWVVLLVDCDSYGNPIKPEDVFIYKFPPIEEIVDSLNKDGLLGKI